MAYYDYECDNCGTVTEREFAMETVKKKVKCPNCGKMANRVWGRPNAIVRYRGMDAMANISGKNARRNRGRGW
jgi:putative FmdB family regulatory protein